MSAIDCTQSTEISIEKIQAHLIPVNTPTKIHSRIDIIVTKPQLNKYDDLMGGGAAV